MQRARISHFLLALACAVPGVSAWGQSAALPTPAGAAEVKIGLLSAKYCVSDDFNSHVYLALKGATTSDGPCVLTFLRQSPQGEPLEHEAQALIRVNGALVYLQRKESGLYTVEPGSGQEAVTVVLQVQETGTTCVEGEDKCCGSDYAGVLTVHTAQGKASVRVRYYRGG